MHNHIQVRDLEAITSASNFSGALSWSNPRGQHIGNYGEGQDAVAPGSVLRGRCCPEQAAGSEGWFTESITLPDRPHLLCPCLRSILV